MTTDNSTAPATMPVGESAPPPPSLEAEGRLMLRIVQHWIEGLHAEPTEFVPHAWDAKLERLQELHGALYRNLSPETRLRDSVLAALIHFAARPEQMGPPYEQWLAVTQEIQADLASALGGEIGAYLAATEQREKVQ